MADAIVAALLMTQHPHGDTQASSVEGPFTEIDGFAYPGGNPAPIYHNGSFYLTNQQTGAWKKTVCICAVCEHV